MARESSLEFLEAQRATKGKYLGHALEGCVRLGPFLSLSGLTSPKCKMEFELNREPLPARIFY